MTVPWWSHALWLSSYLGLGVVLAAVNAWMGTRGGLSSRRGFAISTAIWLPGLAVFYAVIAVLA